jgi:hypothetical protein
MQPRMCFIIHSHWERDLMKVSNIKKYDNVSILSYNINFGLVRNLSKKISTYAQNVGIAIKKANADIILLQETNEPWVIIYFLIFVIFFFQILFLFLFCVVGNLFDVI